MTAPLNTVAKEAGAIVIRFDNDQPNVLLVTAKTNRAHWIFPKGHVEPGESPQQTAVREAREEAGVIVEAADRVGVTHYTFNARDHEVEYYLCRLRSETTAMEAREKAWVPLAHVEERLTFDNLRDVFRSARDLIRGAGR